MGLDILLGWQGQTAAEQAALMNGEVADQRVGYLRSSYNETGFLRWADCHIGSRHWYWIFDYDDEKLKPVGTTDKGEELLGFFPDWSASLERFEEALEIAKGIDHRLFLIPMPKPDGQPEEYPPLGSVLNAYFADREELNRTWGEFKGPGPPLKSQNGRYATEWARILAVMWHQTNIYRSGSPPSLELQPVLVCEASGDIHQGYIRTLEATKRFIEFGQEKDSWLLWSG